MQSDTIKQGMITRSIEKNGTPWALSKNGIASQTKSVKNKLKFVEQYPKLTVLEYSEEKFGTCKMYDSSCCHEFEITKWQINYRYFHNIEVCTICNPIGSFIETIWQKEIEDFLVENNIKYLKNNRSVLGNLEIDFYLLEFKVGIELDGIYWHSAKHKESKYHINKTDRCEKLGIQLLHVFEDEWNKNKELVFSRIRSLLNIGLTKVYAKSCEIRLISGKEASCFINLNHFQGGILAKHSLALFYNGEIVAVMMIGATNRKNKLNLISKEYEIYRFCTKVNHLVIGGFSKLLKFFIREYKPHVIISQVDRRWFVGYAQTTSGFQLIKKLNLNFNMLLTADVKNS
jgi:very-short-patch-repair endonuclease